MATKSRGYTAEDIEILEDLTPLLHRPGMYTDPANPNHALVEVIDNASDEGLAGFATRVAVILHEDGSASVEDDGRGIPVDIHPKKKVPAVQVIFTTLHSGGKFRKTDKEAVYRIAGGLHAVDAARFQIHIHVIGDKAARAALDGLQRAFMAGGVGTMMDNQPRRTKAWVNCCHTWWRDWAASMRTTRRGAPSARAW